MSAPELTLADLREGRGPQGVPCAESDELWGLIDLADSTTLSELREWWTVERAVELSRADGAGPRVGAVAWVGASLGADLSGAYLSGADLSDACLRGADLSGAYLSDACLRGADLSDACLRGADLSGAYLSGADLSGADLSDADLRGADLRGADLSGACLRGADLSGAYRPKGGVDGWEPDERGMLRRVTS